MHSQKIKTLLKSINNLKKEVQQEKFDKKDNVRIQKIQRLEKDIELMEVAINALRKHVNNED
jgi:ribosomal protein S15P/S13E